MRKRKIFDALNSQSTLWIKASAARPSIYMKKSTILLHYLILRKRGEYTGDVDPYWETEGHSEWDHAAPTITEIGDK